MSMSDDTGGNEDGGDGGDSPGETMGVVVADDTSVCADVDGMSCEADEGVVSVTVSMADEDVCAVDGVTCEAGEGVVFVAVTMADEGTGAVEGVTGEADDGVVFVTVSMADEDAGAVDGMTCEADEGVVFVTVSMADEDAGAVDGVTCDAEEGVVLVTVSTAEEDAGDVDVDEPVVMVLLVDVFDGREDVVTLVEVDVDDEVAVDVCDGCAFRWAASMADCRPARCSVLVDSLYDGGFS